MSGPRFPEGWSIEALDKSHPRRKFNSGNSHVDEWLTNSALQSQKKRLTTTKVLLDETRQIVGYYSLAFCEVDFSELPVDLVKKLPRRQLPVSVAGTRVRLPWASTANPSVQAAPIGRGS